MPGCSKNSVSTASSRLVVPIFPEEIQQFAHLVLVLLLGNVLYVGFVTLAQKRLDLMLGYSSVMHMGYAFLGFVALNQLGLGRHVAHALRPRTSPWPPSSPFAGKSTAAPAHSNSPN